MYYMLVRDLNQRANRWWRQDILFIDQEWRGRIHVQFSLGKVYRVY